MNILGFDTALPDIHAELRRKVRLNVMLGVPFMGLIAAGIFRSVIAAGLRGDEDWALMLLRTSIGIGFVWAASHMWKSAARHRRMTWVLERTAVLRVKVSVGKLSSGAITVVMCREDADERSGWSMLYCPPSWDALSLDGAVLDAHIDPRPGGPIVIRTPKGILWPLEGSTSNRTTPATLKAGGRPPHGDSTGQTPQGHPEPLGSVQDELWRRAAPPPAGSSLAALVSGLRADGLLMEADWVEQVTTGVAWTSASEMSGELGLALKKIGRSSRTRMNAATAREFDRVAEEVRSVWPRLL
jgi:hypothetical protein